MAHGSISKKADMCATSKKGLHRRIALMCRMSEWSSMRKLGCKKPSTINSALPDDITECPCSAAAGINDWCAGKLQPYLQSIINLLQKHQSIINLRQHPTHKKWREITALYV
jgi:hypothetical protein